MTASRRSRCFCTLAEGRQRIAGVTHHRDDSSPFEVDGFMGVDDAFEVATQRLHAVRRERYEKGAAESLRDLERTCRAHANIMPAMMAALDAEVTLGEIGDIYRQVWGDWATPIQT